MIMENTFQSNIMTIIKFIKLYLSNLNCCNHLYKIAYMKEVVDFSAKFYICYDFISIEPGGLLFFNFSKQINPLS